MSPLSIVLSFLALLAAGCSSTTSPAPLSSDHPGSPAAEVGAAAMPSETLSTANVPPPPNSDAQPGMHAGHQMSGDQPAAAATADQYVCPMHADVTSDKPGKCPKCEMTLVKKAAAGVNSGGAHHGH